VCGRLRAAGCVYLLFFAYSVLDAFVAFASTLLRVGVQVDGRVDAACVLIYQWREDSECFVTHWVSRFAIFSGRQRPRFVMFAITRRVQAHLRHG
jgi:hypothetical protein